jgi:hypothetical protein
MTLRSVEWLSIFSNQNLSLDKEVPMIARNLFVNSLLAVTLGSVCLSQAVVALPRMGMSEAFCEGLSDYMISRDGNCVNLSYFNGGRPKFFPDYERKITKFEQALAKLNVPVIYTKCEELKPGLILYGFYSPVTNQMTICDETQKDSQRQVYETLVHESWHTVQDCIAGLDNPNILALSQAVPKFRQEVLGGISVEDFVTMDQAYSKDERLTESEARFMSNKPQLVLEWLGRCKAYSSHAK